jgi:hypothetical protein
MTRNLLAVGAALALAVIITGSITAPAMAATHKSCRWLHPVGKPPFRLCIVVTK